MSTGSVPADLESMSPGLQLAEALAAVDLSACDSADLYRLSALHATQIAYEQAQLLHVMLEAVYAERTEALQRTKSGASGPASRVREFDEFSADQLAFTLTWSRTAAQAQLLAAQDLIERIPVVFTALRAGRIDLVRARVFSDALSGLDDDKDRTVAERLIEKAENWTPGRLRERLRYHVLKADPTLGRKRYETRVSDRRIYNQPYADGTSQLSGVNLPPHLAIAVFNRIDRMARAAKSAGDTRTLEQLRADAYLDVLSGRPFVLSPSLDDLTAAADQAARNLGLSTDDPAH